MHELVPLRVLFLMLVLMLDIMLVLTLPQVLVLVLVRVFVDSVISLGYAIRSGYRSLLKVYAERRWFCVCALTKM